MVIVDGRLYTMGDISLGSEQTQCVLTYDLTTHKRLWAAKVGPVHNDGGPRCTPTVDNGSVYAIGTSGDLVCIDVQAGGVRQYVQLTNKGLIGVAAKNGKFLWGYNKIANSVANIPTPIVYGNFIFCSTAYNTGSVLLELTVAGDGVDAKEIYFLNANTLQNHHGGLVRVGDYIYGGHGHGKGKPTCIEAKTGKVMWQKDQPGGGSAAVLYADGNLYFRYEDNTMALIKADPESYNLISTFKLPKRPGMSGPGWSHLVIVDGRLYARHSDVLMVYDIKAK